MILSRISRVLRFLTARLWSRPESPTLQRWRTELAMQELAAEMTLLATTDLTPKAPEPPLDWRADLAKQMSAQATKDLTKAIVRFNLAETERATKKKPLPKPRKKQLKSRKRPRKSA
jgi:hypothetical protein